jgi:orotidine-5'-phosphate decarboxylase
LIVALDTDASGARALGEQLAGTIRWVKVGMTLYYEEGPSIVRELQDFGFDVFLDLKLHDIPHQVRGAAATVSRLGVQMLTVHASGGEEMLRAAVEGAHEGAAAAGTRPPAVLAVTVLTSMDDATLASVGVMRSAAEQVPVLASVAATADVDGVVCSPNEAYAMRTGLRPGAFVVTPGIRPAGSDAGDQSRIATPAVALRSGASHLVVGRPITGAADPAEAASRVLAEMEEAL